jgi:hypothetical protein
MKLQEKIKRVKELNETLKAQSNLPTFKRMDDKEWQIVVREINCLDKQIEAEESLEKGEWRKGYKQTEQMKKEIKTLRYNI